MGIDYTKFTEDRSSCDIKGELERTAYFNWLNAGCPEGRHVEFWCEAEREMFGYTVDEYWDAMEDNGGHASID